MKWRESAEGVIAQWPMELTSRSDFCNKRVTDVIGPGSHLNLATGGVVVLKFD
jgi:hypothetical protein